MTKKNEKDNDILAYMAFVILLLGLIMGTCFIVSGIKCSSFNEITSCMFGIFIMLTFLVISFMMYIAARRDDLKKLFDEFDKDR